MISRFKSELNSHVIYVLLSIGFHPSNWATNWPNYYCFCFKIILNASWLPSVSAVIYEIGTENCKVWKDELTGFIWSSLSLTKNFIYREIYCTTILPTIGYFNKYLFYFNYLDTFTTFDWTILDTWLFWCLNVTVAYMK